MKQIKRILLTAVAILSYSITASAYYDFILDGIFYSITSSTDLEVEVTYTGYSYNDNKYTGEITIPESVIYNNTTYRVARIGNFAFYGCSNLTAITIPNSVVSIGQYAFENCI